MSISLFHFTTSATWWYISAACYIIVSLSICFILCSYAINTFKSIFVKNEADHSTSHLNQRDKTFFYILLTLTFLTIFFYFLSMTIITILDFVLTPNNMENIHLSLMSCLIAIKSAASLYFIAKECIHLVFILRLHVIYGDTYFKYHPKLLLIFALITLIFTFILILITEFTMQSDIIYTNTPIELINTYNEYSCDASFPNYLLILFVLFDTITSSILSYLFIKPLHTTFNATVHDKEMREKIKNNPKHLHKLKSSIEKSVSTGATRLNKLMTRPSYDGDGTPLPYDATPIHLPIPSEFPDDNYDLMPADSDKKTYVNPSRRSVVQSESRYSSSRRETRSDGTIYIPQQMSYMTSENLLIKKYLIISHIAIITTIICIIIVLSTDILGFIIFDMLIHCICVIFMNKSYNKWYKRICCGAIFVFDVFEECSECCKRNPEIDSLKRKGHELSDVMEETETQSLSSM